MSFEVRVVDEKGEAVAGVRVVLSFVNSTRGMTDPEITDEEGCAEFSGYQDGDFTLFLDGADSGTFDYRDGSSITVVM
jgi:hypothetical protein